MYIPIEDMRKYLNLPFCDDDYLLGQFIESAEDVVTGHLNIESLSVYEDENGNLPAALQTAIKTVAANFYMNRESVSFGEPYKLPYSLEYILQVYKNYSK